ncbi:Cof-type HAD-IIB family hydrolase [Actinoplanes utahensis]|uniref:Haloacid dehalogenase n=1 Tax=Actinoplanes utahensis TaxID=1869 RepID=A0A0A6UBR9_ACTUT|nr:Cof-type HAD-IIB family hydrolase [Actinoplanes utahensis]KHD72911.1 haloacid dehalogenase [Actinoplanes utahensis]GIF31063.1 haloacid dehalogenase [Actinoplanes utahensis]
MGPFRLVASDIDGTLITGDRTLSPRTLDVLSRVPVPVVVVTGRPLRWLDQLFEQLPAPLPAICANGAVIYDPDTDTVLRTETLPVDLLLDVTKQLRDAVPDISLAVEVEDGRAFLHEDTWTIRWEHDHRVRVIASPEELTSAPAVKLLARSSTADPDEFLELVSSTLGDRVEATRSSSSALVEISAAGVTKAAGLAWYCERHGITADQVVAFGDMPNDIPLLSWAGRGVAVGNAHPALRAVADEVTGTNDDDGVAVYLSSLFDL